MLGTPVQGCSWHVNLDNFECDFFDNIQYLSYCGQDVRYPNDSQGGAADSPSPKSRLLIYNVSAR